MAEEKSFENRVKRYLESIGCYAFGTPNQDISAPVIGYYEKRWGGGQFTKSGIPDMHVVLHSVSIELEIKASSGKPSELQLKNLDLINKSSLGYILVEDSSTVDRIKRYINRKYPAYSHIEVINFEDFKALIEKLKVFEKNILTFKTT